jgi:hypothetical protein
MMVNYKLILLCVTIGAFCVYRMTRKSDHTIIHIGPQDAQWKARLIEFFVAEDIDTAFETFQYLVDNDFSEARAFDIVVHNRG